MRNQILPAVVAVWLASCTPQGATVRVTVNNPCDYDRTDELVEIPLDALLSRITFADGETCVVTDGRGETVVSQVTHDGKLVFQAGVKARGKASYTVSAGEPQVFASRTFGRLVAERYDDFAWENDRVAFRIYGAALIPVDGPSNGLDLWYKRTAEPVIDRWYGDDLAGIRSYHEDHGEGLDDYKVGRTLGGGMMAPYVDSTLRLNENFVRHELLENGPLRTTFTLIYSDLNVDGRMLSERRTFSLDAGSQLTKVTQAYGGTGEVLPVAAGIVKRDGDDAIFKSRTKNGTAALVYAEPESDAVGRVYVGMVFPSGFDATTVDTYTLTHAISGREETHSHLLALTSCSPGMPVVYYTGFGWSKFGFPSVDDFEAYIGKFMEGLDRPLLIKY
ncbi:MAG: DUF4861 domain-containing protein [Tannerella sp.]|jgi:hypothetical protein|nr:DUF4861 domain-containing protein [Tannerella sp.]